MVPFVSQQSCVLCAVNILLRDMAMSELKNHNINALYNDLKGHIMNAVKG